MGGLDRTVPRTGSTDSASVRGRVRQRLRRRIRKSLRDQGFTIARDRIVPLDATSKEAIRRLHQDAVRHAAERSRRGLERREPELLSWIASGNELSPREVRPSLIEVRSGTIEELLFRWVRLHWSIPVSAGYGRRLRFLVVDQSNQKLIGIIGLSDPVFALEARDRAIGWTPETRRMRLRHVMDAFVLGAVPPYSGLLFGKLVAMLAASNEVRMAFSQRYRDTRSLISGRSGSGELAMITTTSALGRSSIYNRLRFKQETMYQRVGYTAGSGDFQFMNGLYSELRAYAVEYLQPTAKHEDWGTGFRNRRELVRKVLGDLGLSVDWQYHGVQREVFVIPTAKNTSAFLRGDAEQLQYWDRPVTELVDYFRRRWLLPRARTSAEYRDFDASDYVLWPTHRAP